MVIGEQVMIMPLIVVHLLQTFIKHNPYPIKEKAEQAVYDNKNRVFLIDMAICCMLVIVLLEKHPLAAEVSKASTKLDQKKLPPKAKVAESTKAE